MKGGKRSFPFATSVGQAEKYSLPVTEFWMYQLAAARALAPGASADALFAACPQLLDKNPVNAYRLRAFSS